MPIQPIRCVLFAIVKLSSARFAQAVQHRAGMPQLRQTPLGLEHDLIENRWPTFRDHARGSVSRMNSL
jgi:hypothetical protein